MHAWRRQTPDDADQWLAGFRSLAHDQPRAAGDIPRRLSLRSLRLGPPPPALPSVLTELRLEDVCDEDQDL